MVIYEPCVRKTQPTATLGLLQVTGIAIRAFGAAKDRRCHQMPAIHLLPLQCHRYERHFVPDFRAEVMNALVPCHLLRDETANHFPYLADGTVIYYDDF